MLCGDGLRFNLWSDRKASSNGAKIAQVENLSLKRMNTIYTILFLFGLGMLIVFIIAVVAHPVLKKGNKENIDLQTDQSASEPKASKRS